MPLRFALALVLLTGCLPQGGGSQPDPLPDAGLYEDAGGPATDADPPDAADVDARPPRPLQIQLDYRLDETGWFEDPLTRAVVEAAALAWSAHLADDFPELPEGVWITTRQYEQNGEISEAVDVQIEEGIDDLLVFVQCVDEFAGAVRGKGGPSSPSGQNDRALRNRMQARLNGYDFEPFAGSVALLCDQLASPPPDEEGGYIGNDLFSVMLHELGHVLGFTDVPPFTRWVEGRTFVGPTASFLQGGPVPMAPDPHLRRGLLSDNARPVMLPGHPGGAPVMITPIDLAVLRDLGYEVVAGLPDDLPLVPRARVGETCQTDGEVSDCAEGRCSDGVCVECLDDADCAVGTCEDQVCIECFSDDQCARGTCEAGQCAWLQRGQRCDAPGAQGRCGAGLTCHIIFQVCLPCSTDEHCEAGVCHEQGYCVQCFVDSDCRESAPCDASINRCQYGRYTDPCSPPGEVGNCQDDLICHPNGHCAQCVTDDDCPEEGRRCQRGLCSR